MKVQRCVCVVLLLAALSAGRAVAITCPSGGAKVRVVVNNPTTTGQTATISGAVISGEATCGGQATSYSQVVTLTQLGDNEFVVPASGGLVSGMWVHRILVNATVGQDQYQQGPVLSTDDTNRYTKVAWTYFANANVIVVNQPGDNSCAGCGCTNSCTFREALNRAIQNPAALPTLIRFSQSPGTMTQTLDLNVGSASTGPMIIDGTDASGNPWIVGDALAAAQGGQDTFPRVVDLANVTKLKSTATM